MAVCGIGPTASKQPASQFTQLVVRLALRTCVNGRSATTERLLTPRVFLSLCPVASFLGPFPSCASSARQTNASTSLFSLLILHRLVICRTYFPSRFDLVLIHIQCPPPASRLQTTPTPLPLSLCTAFLPLPPRPRFPNTLTLLQIPVSSACIQTTPPALVECIRLSHRTSPILLFVFCSLPCMITPFPSK